MQMSAVNKTSATLLLLAVIVSAPALACRCQQIGLDEYFTNAEVVALAAVESVTRPDSSDTAWVIGVRIIELFKGEPVTQVITAASSAACGMNLVSDNEIWLFARRIDASGLPEINTCNGSRLFSSGYIGLEQDQVLARLREMSDQPVGIPDKYPCTAD